MGALVNPYPVLASAALHVLSSRWEGYPNALLEALELRVPVVATDCPSGPRELLRDGRLGRLVPVGDDAALACAMDAELLAPMVNDGRQLDDYRPAAVAQRYLEVLLGDTRGSGALSVCRNRKAADSSGAERPA
jgi:glycosyltransferase involved in cell wall biosynthesis